MTIINLIFLKILFILKENSYSINTGELAEKTKINKKNIGRYLSSLEEMEYIERDIFQEGKKRFILNLLTSKGIDYEIPRFYKLYFKNYYN